MKKIIVVGGGYWGTNHIRTLMELNCFSGVVEPDSKNQNKLKEKFPNINIFNNLNESFNHSVDGYTVATPPDTHFDIGCAIVNNYKPVLIEKPLTMNYHTSNELVQLAKKNKVNLFYREKKQYFLLDSPFLFKIALQFV